MIRLFDEHFTTDDVRRADLALHMSGPDGFAFTDRSSMAEISPPWSRRPRTGSRRGRASRTRSATSVTVTTPALGALGEPGEPQRPDCTVDVGTMALMEHFAARHSPKL
jgi:fumarylacetoacetate (FAA) hydrolase family protein